VTHQTALAQRTDYSRATTIGRTLDAARTEIEKRFLDGGAVLLSARDVVTRLTSALEQLAPALTDSSNGGNDADLAETIRQLSDLPASEANRQSALGVLSGAGSKLRTHVSDMQETMRYLQTFAITVKITGAGIPEFAGFAEEILERIRSGTAEVNNFAGQLSALDKDVKIAQAFGGGVSSDNAQTVAKAAKALEDDARAISDQRKALGRIVAEISALARGIENKITATLSSLQIGDVTRHRIERVQSMLGMAETFLASAEGRALDRSAQQRLETIIQHLAAAHMADMVEDFQRESRTIVETITSFNADTREILSLGGGMQSPQDNKGTSIIRAIEGSAKTAQAIFKQGEDASLKANQVGQSTMATAANMLQGITNIRSVKTDIHYMALNTNLRCSRMGEEGRSINVVTAELRFFAAKLDESADAIVSGLSSFEDAAGRIADSNTKGGSGLDQQLTSWIGTIRAAGSLIDSELANLSEHTQELARTIALSMSKLDFQHDLGDVLATCTNDLFDLAGPDLPDVSDLGDALNSISGQVFALYTTAQERAIHDHILPMNAIAPVRIAAAG
jgi:hypothetical protein